MKLYSILIFYLITISLAACADRRFKLIEESFGISLPGEYKVLENTTEPSGLAGSDIHVNIKLEFDEKHYQELKKKLGKIEKIKDDGTYFNELNDAEYASIIIDDEKKQMIFQFTHL